MQLLWCKTGILKVSHYLILHSFLGSWTSQLKIFQKMVFKLPKYVLSASQKTKAYVDELTILSTSRSDHQFILSSVNTSCQDVGFEIRPDKCVSYFFHGQKPLPCLSFQLLEGCTSNILLPLLSFSGKHWVSLQL